MSGTGSGRGAVVVLQEAAESLAALHLARRGLEEPRPGLVGVGERDVALRLVRALLVVVGHKLGHEVPQVALAHDDEVIEALGPQRLDPALRVCVHVGRPRPDALNRATWALSTASNEEVNFGSLSVSRCVAVRFHSAICVVALRACCATHAESGLAVGAETITRRVPTWMKNNRYRSTNPAVVSVRTDTKSLTHRVAAWRHELVPGSCAALGTRVEPRLCDDVLDRGATDSVDPELLQLPEDPGVPPAVLPRELHHQRADLFGGARPTGFAGRFRALVLQGRSCNGRGPSAEGAVGDDRDEVPNGATDGGAEFDEAVLLVCGEGNRFGELGAEDRILRFEVLDHLTQLVVGRSGEEGEERLE